MSTLSKVYHGWNWLVLFRGLWCAFEDRQTVTAAAAAGVSFASAMLSFGVGLATIAFGRRSARGDTVPQHAPVTVSQTVNLQVPTYSAIDPEYPTPAWLDLAVINLAVVGRTTAGKSSLINFLRNVQAGEQGAAIISDDIGTSLPTPFDWQIPGCSRAVRLWDCPGTETPGWTLGYVQQIGLRYFDVVLVILPKPRFAEESALVAECLKFGVPVHVVVTQVDKQLESSGPNAAANVELAVGRWIDDTSKSAGLAASRFHVLTGKHEPFQHYEDFFGHRLHRFLNMLSEDIWLARFAEGSSVA
mmetsp:Transcript_75282/g.104576  ORF Transcript_75282/g.104576 Transcript_75282/m.104576 type:complete len:302 (+) Transcript_75282:41-946(+)